ncbi:Rieske (2Fe-2S) protein [Asticcacaulis machinosus]|uniref:Rieske (2Fe-2S) protein n=1 Tax=Asticcacaulis machinosus TaxID=2984211 RepID=A0ABT5HJZ0_9CAUL|nr:Rieske (2Fe-2S) protein [Asticcacaulis machinosus]MDC7676567.1 Rieske (2Fe-2S) protein [Asticcacaulis machinosus]
MTERLSSTRAGIALGPLAQIPDGTARNYVLKIGEAYFHGFIVRQDNNAFGYVDACPHAGLPLAQELDHYLTSTGDLIMCSWHGALFKIQDGACIGGPCAGAKLTPWPVIVRAGELYTA